MLDTGKDFSTFGQLIILILLQCGGLGIMTMSTIFAFLVGKRISLRHRLIMQESLNQFSIGGLVRLAKYILIFTAVIESVGATILFFSWQRIYSPLQALYLGIFHSISAFCNAGFFLFSDSIMCYKGDLVINLTFIVLISFNYIRRNRVPGFIRTFSIRKKRDTLLAYPIGFKN